MRSLFLLVGRSRLSTIQASLIHVIVGGMLAFPFHLAMFTTRIPSRMAERLECAESLDLL